MNELMYKGYINECIKNEYVKNKNMNKYICIKNENMNEYRYRMNNKWICKE